jgi:hypothetical protein
MTTYNINENHSSSNRPNYQLGISKPTAKIPNYSSLDILRPENYNKYYTNIPTEFNLSLSTSELIECIIIRVGSGYPSNTTVSFEPPDDPEGTQASGQIYFAIKDESLNLTHAGTGYSINDTIAVFSDDSYFPGVIEIDDVDSSGSILQYSVTGPGVLKISDSNPLSTVSGNNNSAIFTFNDSYEIAYIDMIEPGNGYNTLDNSGNIKIYEPIVEEVGSGFIGYATTIGSPKQLLYAPNTNFKNNPRERILVHGKYNLHPNYDSMLPSSIPTGILY